MRESCRHWRVIAGDRANSDEEKPLVAAYKELLTNYKDTSTIWKHQIESSKYEWAKNQIVVGELVPVAAKYKLPVTELTAGRTDPALVCV